MDLPTDRECFRIIRKMEMMDHIVDHSVMVSNVAVCLGLNIKKKKHCINIDLVRKAALLHDITKTRSFSTGEIHSETGASLVVDMGYPEIGEVIRQHVMLDELSQDSPVSEPEIVNYADKRVLHDQVVSLDRRLAYIRERYGSRPEFSPMIDKMWEATLALEKKIFRYLTFTPAQLPAKVRPSIKKEG